MVVDTQQFLGGSFSVCNFRNTSNLPQMTVFPIHSLALAFHRIRRTAMVINEESASHETSICQCMSQPEAMGQSATDEYDLHST